MHPELFTIPGVNITVPSFGATVMVGFLLATWWAALRCKRVKVDPDMILNLGFIILIFGTLSARVFYVVHYWSTEFAHQPSQVFNIKAGGMEVYGGIIGGVIACGTYIKLKGMSFRLLADIVAPSLLLAMGIGRLGCFLFGCCWGSVCPENLPWAVRFPFGSPAYQQQWEHRLLTAPAELIFIAPDGAAGPMPRQILAMSNRQLDDRLAQIGAAVEKARASGDSKKVARAEKNRDLVLQGIKPLTEHLATFGTTLEALREEAAQPANRALALHPSQLYSFVGPVLLALITGSYFYRRKRHGTVILLGMTLYAMERFIEELVRTDNPIDTFGLTISQAISVGVLVLAVIYYAVIRQLPLRSPCAVAFVPKTKTAASEPVGPGSPSEPIGQ